MENVSKTLAFYQQAFGLNIAMLHESGDYGELETSKTKLAFSSQKLMAALGKPTGKHDARQPAFEIGFETGDVKASLQQALSAGATLIQNVREELWGQTTSYVADDNGFLIEICSPVRPLS